ncbi:BNR-4 repeat-containing protein [Fodinibius sp. N2]|uniref:BNR-4 repeat-containing protein n=1 Tax=Fodinibius alkaliphilus TaxID=3140241 RepID=UPI00315AB836
MEHNSQNIIYPGLTNSRYFILGFLLLGIFVGCSESYDEKSPTIGADFPVFTENGAWCWFSDPRAVYFEGKHQRTYAGWVSSEGDIVVGYYDHEDSTTQTKIIDPDFQADDHNNPSIVIRPDGKLLVFYSKHATEEPILLQRSKSPEDIMEWEGPEKLDLNDDEKYNKYSDTYTYTNPIYLEDEDTLYLFWRGSDFKPNYAFSKDWGESWSRGEIAILPDREYKDRRPYVKLASNGRDKIHFAFTQGHPRLEENNSIYYMAYNDGEYSNADGSMIADTLPIAPPETDLVYNGNEGPKAWIWDVAADQNGTPAIVYATFPNDSTHIYHYAKWDGSSWQNHKLVDSGRWFPETPEGEQEREPNYSGGIALDHENPNIVYLSRQREGTFEIEKWVTPDGGKSWQQESITTGSDTDNVRPVAIRNAVEGNKLQVLWMLNEEYIHYTNYSSSIKMNQVAE